MRFFKKEVPKTPIWLPNGDALRFESIDGYTGYHQTADTAVIDVLKLLESQRRGGVREISQEEFEREFSKKKLTSTHFDYNLVNREELGAGVAPDTLVRPQAQPVASLAVVNPPKPPEAETTVNPPPTVKAPKVGKRKSSAE